MNKIVIGCILICLLFGCSNNMSLSCQTISESSENVEYDSMEKDKSPDPSQLEDFEGFDLDKIEISKLPTEIDNDPLVWNTGIHLVSYIPEEDIALYAPLDTQNFSGVLVRKGKKLEKFDWKLSRYLFHAGLGDYDCDGINEIAVGNCTGQGLQLYHEDLHIIEINSDSSMSDFCMPKQLYEKELTQQVSFKTEVDDNKIFISISDKLTSNFVPRQNIPKILKEGDGILPIYNIIHYKFKGDEITGNYGVLINFSTWNGNEYATEIQAKINYLENNFTITPTNLLPSFPGSTAD